MPIPIGRPKINVASIMDTENSKYIIGVSNPTDRNSIIFSRITNF